MPNVLITVAVPTEVLDAVHDTMHGSPTVEPWLQPGRPDPVTSKGEVVLHDVGKAARDAVAQWIGVSDPVQVKRLTFSHSVEI